MEFNQGKVFKVEDFALIIFILGLIAYKLINFNNSVKKLMIFGLEIEATTLVIITEWALIILGCILAMIFVKNIIRWIWK